MSVLTRITIDCDHYDKDAPAGQRLCYSLFEWPAGYDGRQTASALRRLAKAAGWTYVRSDLARWADKDFCPAHRPAGAS